MLPTPTAFDWNSARTEQKWEEDKQKWADKGVNLQMPLKQMARFEMLPTPTTHDSKHSTTKSPSLEKRIKQKHLAETVLNPFIQEKDGKPSQLSPQFVLEMMGFPTDWTELPFLNGETSQSKPEEMQ
jgi:hypothetical protein